MSKSIIQTEKKCFITGNTLYLHKHHIFGGPFRKKSEEYGLWVYLRPDHHIQTRYAIHNDRDFDLRLKRLAQRKFEEKYSHELFMKEFGKNYL